MLFFSIVTLEYSCMIIENAMSLIHVETFNFLFCKIQKSSSESSIKLKLQVCIMVTILGFTISIIPKTKYEVWK